MPFAEKWRFILKGTLKGLSEDNLSIIAAGVAFYAFLSVPALLTSLVSIYGLIANPDQVERQMASLQMFIPEEVLAILSDQLSRVSAQAGGTLTIALFISILFALWSGANSVRALMTALNVANGEGEKRGWLKLNATALSLTLGAVVAMVITIALVVATTALVGSLNIPASLKVIILIARWPLLAAIALVSLGVVYRYGPSRSTPKWKWVSWGAGVAMLLWVGASGIFSWYVGSFGSYNKTYGSLAAIAVLLMWLYISAFVVILGAKLNAEIEYQIARVDSSGPITLGGAA